MSETAINIVRLADVVAQSRKNGGGVTRELLAWPSADDWVVRVSVADIERDGSFSVFEGVERHFAVLSGNGVRLFGIDEFRAGGKVACFDGEIAPYCELIDGPTRDLNVMIRRDAGHGTLRRLDRQREAVLALDAKLHGVYCEQSETLTWTVGAKGIWLGDVSGRNLAHEGFLHFRFFSNA